MEDCTSQEDGTLRLPCWAAAVGMVYGVLALATGDAAAAMVAHVSCNFISGVAWKSQQSSGDIVLENDQNDRTSDDDDD